MTKAGAVAGLISALATASLSQNVVYADGPFNFSTFTSSAGAAKHPSPSATVPQTAPAAVTDESRGGGGGERKSVKNDKPMTGSAGFDHVALERGAAALDKISKSRNAAEIFEILKKQEETKQIENALKAAECKAMEAQHELERERALSEARERHAQKQAELKKQMLQYSDDLARSQQRFENELMRNRNRELVELQEQSEAKLEQIKRDTEEALERARQKTEEEKAKMEQETYRIKAKADAEAKALEKKETEDIRRQEHLTTANAEREKWIAAINTTFDHIGAGLKAILTDRNKLIVVVGGTTALAAGVYTSREGAKVIWRYVDRMLGQPSLIRESSRGKYPWSGFFRRGLSTLSRDASKGNGSQNGFGDVILHPSLQKRIQQLANATANTKVHQAPFRNMLFYGPPGTGKTMAARELAKKSGLDYALMTGGDVAPLGPQAVTKIHQLFDWAKKSNRGLLLFIDEADAFLCERNKTYMSEAQRSALNALLFRTGDQSKDIVLALATNRPEDLDSAVADRIDEVLEFLLPGEEERFKLLKLYLNKYIAQAGERKPGLFSNLFKKEQQKIEIKGVTEEILREAAAKTEGFSGREIAKLMASVQAACYGSDDCVLDANLFREVVDYKVAEHQQRQKLAGTDTDKTKDKI